MDQERARGRRGPGPPGPDAGRHGPRRRGPTLVREGDQARPHPPRPAAGPDLPARQDQKFAEAAAQYEALDQADPNNPDTLRDWGALVLRDTTKAAARAQGRRRRDLAQAARRPSPTTRSPPPRSPTCCARPSWSTTPWPSTARPSSSLPPTPSITNTSANTSINLKRPDEAKAAWAKIADGTQPERQEPGPAGRGPGRLRLPQGGLRRP